MNSATKLAVKRGYLSKDAVFLKNIAGMPGDKVEINTKNLLINNELKGHIYNTDSKDRPLPIFIINEVIPHNMYFAMATKINNSYDSRYYGYVPIDKIISTAKPLITF